MVHLVILHDLRVVVGALYLVLVHTQSPLRSAEMQLVQPVGHDPRAAPPLVHVPPQLSPLCDGSLVLRCRRALREHLEVLLQRFRAAW